MGCRRTAEDTANHCNVPSFVRTSRKKKKSNVQPQMKIRMGDLLESAGLGQPGQKMIKSKPCGSSLRSELGEQRMKYEDTGGQSS